MTFGGTLEDLLDPGVSFTPERLQAGRAYRPALAQLDAYLPPPKDLTLEDILKHLGQCFESLP